MTNTLRKMDKLLERFEHFLIVFLFSIFILLITGNILSRNFMNESSQLISEKTPLFVLWLALLGASQGIRHQKHIKLELLLRYFKPKLRRIALVIGNAFAFVVMLVLFVASIIFLEGEVRLFGMWGWSSVILPIFFLISSFRFFLATLGFYMTHSEKGGK